MDAHPTVDLLGHLLGGQIVQQALQQSLLQVLRRVQPPSSYTKRIHKQKRQLMSLSS